METGDWVALQHLAEGAAVPTFMLLLTVLVNRRKERTDEMGKVAKGQNDFISSLIEAAKLAPELLAALDDERKDKETLRASNEKIVSDNAELTQANLLLQKENGALKKQNERLVRDLDDLRARVGRLEKERDDARDLAQQVPLLEGRIIELQNQLAGKQREIDEARGLAVTIATATAAATVGSGG